MVSYLQKIKSIDVIILIYYITQAFLFFVQNKMINAVNHNYLLYVGVALFLSLGIILMFGYLLRYDEKKNIFGLLKNKYLIFLFLIIPLILSIFCLDNVTKFISYVYLKDVNKVGIMISFSLVVFYLLNNDYDTLFRTSTLMFYFYFIIEVLTFILLLFYIDFDNLLPITTNFEVAISNSYMFIIFTFLPLFFLLFINKRKISDEKKLSPNMIWGLVIIFLVIAVKNIFCVMILGYDTISFYNYPEITIYKNIELFGFVERIEWLLGFNTITNYFFLITLGLTYVKEGLNYILPLKKDIKYLYPLILSGMMLIGCFLFRINYVWIIYLGVIYLVMHLVLTLFCLVK